jgi:hypothetical protein
MDPLVLGPEGMRVAWSTVWIIVEVGTLRKDSLRGLPCLGVVVDFW